MNNNNNNNNIQYSRLQARCWWAKNNKNNRNKNDKTIKQTWQTCFVYLRIRNVNSTHRAEAENSNTKCLHTMQSCSHLHAEWWHQFHAFFLLWPWFWPEDHNNISMLRLSRVLYRYMQTKSSLKTLAHCFAGDHHADRPEAAEQPLSVHTSCARSCHNVTASEMATAADHKGSENRSGGHLKEVGDAWHENCTSIANINNASLAKEKSGETAPLHPRRRLSSALACMRGMCDVKLFNQNIRALNWELVQIQCTLWDKSILALHKHSLQH